MPNERRSKSTGMNQLPFPLEDIDIVELEDAEEFSVDAITYLESNIPDVVSVVLLRHKIVNVTGKFTGRKYTFSGAGSIVNDVDRQDAEALVNKYLPPSCCGSFPTPQFQILG